MAPSPTMKDVAREAGVALKTVSRFVNGETNINPAMSARIEEAILRLGYRRNLAAASIRPGRASHVLGLIIEDLSNPYYSALTAAVEAYAHARGYLLVTASSEEDGSRHDRLVDRMMEQRVDGLLVVPPRRPGRRWARVVPPVPPVVFLDRPVSASDAAAVLADTVLADNAGGARDATDALIATGARRVAFVGDTLSIYTMWERRAGYERALRTAGLDVHPALLDDGAHTDDQAARIVARLLTTTDADAVFAANNRSSVGALLAFRELGRRVRLIGFDDFEAARLSEPAVSVVSQDVIGMGRKAAELLIDRLGGPPSIATAPMKGPMERRTHVLPTTLVLRGSEQP